MHSFIFYNIYVSHRGIAALENVKGGGGFVARDALPCASY